MGLLVAELVDEFDEVDEALDEELELEEKELWAVDGAWDWWNLLNWPLFMLLLKRLFCSKKPV